MKSAVYQKPAQSAIERWETAAASGARLRDDPVRQHAAAAPPGHAELLLVHETPLHQHVHAGQEVLGVVAGIAVLDDVAELLPVGRAPARVRIEHDVAPGRHPLELVVEGRAVGGVRSAVDVEDQRIALAGVEVRRLEDPGLHALAVEARIDDLLRRADLELGEEGLVDAGQAARRGRGRGVENEQVADFGRGGDHEGEPAAVRSRIVGDDLLVAGRERVDLPGGGVDALQVRAPVIGGAHEDGFAVAAPDGPRGEAPAGSALIAGEAAAHVPVVGAGEEARRFRSDLRDVELGLIVRAHGLAAGSALEREPLAVSAERELADGAVDARGHRHLAPANRYRKDVAVRRLVIRLLHPVRHEVERPPVGREGG